MLHSSTGLENVITHTKALVKFTQEVLNYSNQAKNVHTATQLSSSHTSKVMFKILQARLQQYIKRELPDIQAGFRKAEEPEVKLSTSVRSLKKAREFQKNIYLFY